MPNRVFLDTSYSIAAAIGKDQFHQRARQLSALMKAENTQITTTQAVVFEIGNALSKLKYRQSAIGIIQNLENDPNTLIISVNGALYEAGFELFQNRPDKEWGLVDCISFVVMRERNIEAALTADEHFTQAGFRALLREN